MKKHKSETLVSTKRNPTTGYVLLVVGLFLFSILICFPSKSNFNADLNYPRDTITPSTSKLQLPASTKQFSNLRIGYPNSFPPGERKINYDPLEAFGWTAMEIQFQSLIYNTLVRYDGKTNEIKPALAKKWVTTNDSQSWTFYLREDVLFHDGSPFNSTSVKFLFDRLINPDHPAFVENRGVNLLEFPLHSVEIDDEFQVTITFNRSYSPFIIYEASMINILAPTSFNRTGYLIKPIGTGPYQLDLNKSDDSFISLIKYENCYQGTPPFDTIEIFIQNLTEYGTNNLDLYLRGTEGIKNRDQYAFELSGQDLMFMASFNPEREAFRNKKLRQALNYAINKVSLANVSSSGENLTYIFQKTPTSNLFAPGVQHRNDSIPGYPYDPEYANRLLDEAGYPRNSAGYRFSVNVVPILSAVGRPENEVIKSNLNDIGIDARFVEDVNNSNWERAGQGKYDLLLYISNLLLEPYSDLSWFHRTPDEPPSAGFYNSDIGTLLDLVIQTPVKQEQEYYFYKIQDIIQTTAPMLYLLDLKIVSVGLFGKIHFSFQEEFAPITYEGINLKEKPVYFPHADTIIEKTEYFTLSVDLYMSDNLSDTFNHDFNKKGKFYHMEVDSDLQRYIFRTYYDQIEVDYVEHDELALYRYDINTGNWIELPIVASRSDFRYLEVELEGDVILWLGEKVTKLTYLLLPFVSFLVGGSLIVTLVVILFNIRNTLHVKEVCEL
ncbi:MAG: ABC transporter substrate-binding protein [Candidatus Hodarchaeales archaeon]|jgi:ABC-type transport system substrate-binding protein